MPEHIKVKLTESMTNYGEAGDEVEMSPLHARELAILQRVEGKPEDFEGEGLEAYRKGQQNSSSESKK